MASRISESPSKLPVSCIISRIYIKKHTKMAKAIFLFVAALAITAVSAGVSDDLIFTINMFTMFNILQLYARRQPVLR